jgi:PAS domain S-box-containing protein
VLVASIRSVLRARRAEDPAREPARQWQATFEAIADGVAVVGADGNIHQLNRAYAGLFGRPASELVGMPADKVWGDLPDEKRPFIRAKASRQREAAELEHGDRSLQITVDPILDKDGNFAGGVQIVSDITERRRLEEQFRESQKFETIGTLAAGVAHDFNNLLTSMMGNASLILGELPPDSEFRDRLEDIVKSSQRAANLTRQLLAYSGKARHIMEKVGLSSLISRIHKLIEAAVPKKIALKMRLASGLPAIQADPNQIQQVVLNLVSNAAEAIGDAAGEIEIATGAEEGAVWIEVRDTGCGMNPETKARMFDPFFTTKFTGRGLGLAAVAGIARVHKAEIGVTSAPGSGCTIRISFPAAGESARPPRPAADNGHAAATILVVDDEDIVRRVAQATLEIRGYGVVLAANGLEAIRRVREDPDIELVLLDLTMPVMGGEEAIDEILAARPDIKVIVSTGYDQCSAAERFGGRQIDDYLQKPYTSRQLSDKIKAVLRK